MDNQTKLAIIAILVIIPLSSFAILNSEQSVFPKSLNQSEKIVVITSFNPLYEFTKQIGKEKIDVSVLVPFGIEPHDWEPTISDLQKIQNADLIIVNGVGFENWIDNVEAINSDVVIVDTSNGIFIIQNDPHIWLNPVFAQTQVENIAESIIKLDSTNEKFYRENTDNYISKLDMLDQQIKQELTECKKDFIAFHDAFSYFAIQYGLNQHTIISSNQPHEEPSSRTLESIINLAKDYDIKTIFAEEATDTRTSQVIANEIDGQVLILSPLEIDDSDNYISKMKTNLANLKEALCNWIL